MVFADITFAGFAAPFSPLLFPLLLAYFNVPSAWTCPDCLYDLYGLPKTAPPDSTSSLITLHTLHPGYRG